jgi:hypothetical protein
VTFLLEERNKAGVKPSRVSGRESG